jgi:hypothetical protein
MKKLINNPDDVVRESLPKGVGVSVRRYSLKKSVVLLLNRDMT